MNALLHNFFSFFFNLIFSKCEKVLLLKLIYIKSDPLIKLSTDFSDLLLWKYSRCGVPYSCCHKEPNDVLVNFMCGFEVDPSLIFHFFIHRLIDWVSDWLKSSIFCFYHFYFREQCLLEVCSKSWMLYVMRHDMQGPRLFWLNNIFNLILKLDITKAITRFKRWRK